MKKREIDHLDPEHIHVLTTMEMIRAYINKFKNRKIPVKLPAASNQPFEQPQNISINHIAVVLDGKVEEVIRAENRLAALFLSEPKFIEFDPNKIRPTIGWTYNGENFEEPR